MNAHFVLLSNTRLVEMSMLPNYSWNDDQTDEEMLFWVDDDLIFPEIMQLQEQRDDSSSLLLQQANGDDRIGSSSARTSTDQVFFPAFTELPRNDHATDSTNCRFMFKTKTDLDVLDDGYKWRKYGKKRVKNSPYPRNYYHCSYAGCYVKRRVERDREDPSYVVTTYEGVHNHPVPPSSATTST
ncbi:putative WRKY transcription factor 51 isoform X1 [Iris pallida]|uniref:WRKY transcription factor 51 isoform X1 n=1 Tax=Iris pallida TaxID=29817 RepID=A0AAX6F9J1_IRIPA|nr:putative WRKY transcription factor 51 isoform X1 [Iris pallida]